MKISTAFSFSIGTILSAVFSFITLPISTWIFGADDIGRLAIYQISIGLLVNIISLSLTQSYVREYHEEVNKLKLFLNTFIPGFFVSIIAFLIALIFSEKLSFLLFGIESTFFILLFSISFFFNFIFTFLSHVLRMQERGIDFSLALVVPKLVYLILLLYLYLGEYNLTFYHLILINTLSFCISALFIIYLTRDTWMLSLNEKIDIILLNKLLIFSLPLLFSQFAYWCMTSLDRFFLKHYGGFNDLGLYSLATSISTIVILISSIFSNIWHPFVYKWAKTGIKQEKYVLILDLLFIFVCFFWSLIGVLSNYVKIFFPPSYESINILIVPLSAAPLLYILSEVTFIGIGIKRKSVFLLITTISSLVIYVYLNYILIPHYGVFGAACSTLVSSLVFFILRTEFSIFLWMHIPRKKIYSILFLYITVTLFSIFINNIDFELLILAWVALFSLTFIFFPSRIKYLYKHFIFIRNKFI